MNNRSIILLFKRILYSYIILNGLISLPVASEIWSTHANLIHYYPTDSILIKVLNILSRAGFGNYYWFFVIGQILCCCIALLGYQKRFMGILLYFISANLYLNTGQLQNGGTNLLLIVLFYLIFVNEDADQSKNSRIRIIDISCTNFAFLTIQIQVCILYLVSAVSKLYGSHWLDGSALYYIFNIDVYSTNWVQKHIANADWITIPLTYFTLFFQLAFPITVWIKKLKPLTLLIGFLFHLLIIFIMGITDFGLIMLIMYLPFVKRQNPNDASIGT